MGGLKLNNLYERSRVDLLVVVEAGEVGGEVFWSDEE